MPVEQVAPELTCLVALEQDVAWLGSGFGADATPPGAALVAGRRAGVVARRRLFVKYRGPDNQVIDITTTGGIGT